MEVHLKNCKMSAIIFRPHCVNLSSAATRIFQDNKVNTVTGYVLAPYVTWTSVAMNVQNKQVSLI